MSLIQRIELFQVDLSSSPPRAPSAAQCGAELLLVRLICNDNSEGIGYSIPQHPGAMPSFIWLRDQLLPQLIGRDPLNIEALWRNLNRQAQLSDFGALGNIGLAAIDTALWDWRGKRTQLPLWRLAGGAQPRIAAYSTIGPILTPDPELVEQAVTRREAGRLAIKLFIGKGHVSEDVAQLNAVRRVLGPTVEVIVNAQQKFSVQEARRRADAFAPFNLTWIEEPLADGSLLDYEQLAQYSAVPMALGRSLYHIQQFRQGIQQHAFGIIQIDIARVGGITPWLKIAHMADCFNLTVSPHLSMELQVSLCCAVSNSRWIEYAPQLECVSTAQIPLVEGYLYPPEHAGLGIEWRWRDVESRAIARASLQ